MTWLTEKLHAHVAQAYEVDRVLFDGKSDFQKIMLFENKRFGRVLVLDGVIQTTEADEYVYHEMLVHVPLFAHGGVKRMLIIGGGDGGVLREALRHPVDHVTMVEIDGLVIDLCRRHIPSICGNAFDDPRTRLIVGDGIDFVTKTKERFDVIIVDSTDPAGPGEVLFGESFYRACSTLLTERGVVITQNGVPFNQGAELTATTRQFGRLFRHHGCYLIVVPTYDLGFMALGWGSLGLDLAQPDVAEVRRRYDALGLKTRYYNPAIHQAVFALPNFVRDFVA
ncbi:MAG: polyamine aminopropyltransferase [Alphaproteobacteria bacterium]|nr:polyamine aminopropyltransferase [Alphaproteobacteria bacterium]